MEKRIKQFSLFVLFFALTASAQAQTQPTGIVISTNNGVITIVGYRGGAPVVYLPTSTNGHPVTTIGPNAFLNQNIYGVGIPYGITNIGDNAFNGCARLTNIVIPDSVLSMGGNVFESCSSLTNCTIGANVTSIGIWTFAQCYSLTNVIIPDTVTNLGSSAFYAATNLASIKLSSNLTTIASQTFSECGRLTNLTLPPRITSIGDRGFSYCSGLSHVTLPTALASIGNYAFFSCGNLSGITFPATLTSFGYQAFYGCTSLTNVFFRGDAPEADASVFTSDPNATAYYLPGTVGWDSPYGSIPAVLWDPEAQLTEPNFGIRTNRFGFTITGAPNIPIVIEASTNLTGGGWTALQTCTVTNGSIYFSDSGWTNYSHRYYRFRSP